MWGQLGSEPSLRRSSSLRGQSALARRYEATPRPPPRWVLLPSQALLAAPVALDRTARGLPRGRPETGWCLSDWTPLLSPVSLPQAASGGVWGGDHRLGGGAPSLGCDDRETSSGWLHGEARWAPRSELGPRGASRGLKRSTPPVGKGTGATGHGASVFPASRCRVGLCSNTSHRPPVSGGPPRRAPGLCLEPRLTQRRPRLAAFTFDVLTIGVKACLSLGEGEGGTPMGQEHPAMGAGSSEIKSRARHILTQCAF